MRYLVTQNQQLNNSDQYIVTTVQDSLKILDPLLTCGLDTETKSLDVYTGELLLVQLGNDEIQVAIDTTTINIQYYKSFLENPNRLFILHNAKFDLRWFLKEHIIITNVYDTYVIEKLIYLGYLPGEPGLSLQDCCIRYLNINLDKSVRGEIYKGLTERVIIYGCNDVVYLEKIRDAQLKIIKERNQLKAAQLENWFVVVLAYIEFCGVLLDIDKWKIKIQDNIKAESQARTKLNNWILSYVKEHPEGTSTWIKQDFQGDLFTGFNVETQCAINWNASKQVIPVLQQLGFNLEVRDSDTGQIKNSVEASVLSSQANISTITPLYTKYKQLQKITSTYGQSFIDAVNPVSHRIHTNFSQLMKTGRISSGGKNKSTGEEYLNFQNIPGDAETRSFFIASKGYKWISADYSGQESVILTNISKDPAMIEFFQKGKGDIHSLVAKLSYPDIVGNTPIEEIKSKYHQQRQDAKGVEFAINYGGDANTIASNAGIPVADAQKIYNNYMSGFTGIKVYQDFCRKDVWEKGYILINPLTNHRSIVYDYDLLKNIEQRKNSISNFWQLYKEAKQNHTEGLPKNVIKQLAIAFTTQESISYIVNKYNCIPEDIYYYAIKYLYKRKAQIEKDSINYRIQGTGAIMFKIASIKFFNWLKTNNLLFKVFFTIPVHDEINCEAPEDLTELVSSNLVKCMKEAGKILCTIVPLDVDVQVGDHWIH